MLCNQQLRRSRSKSLSPNRATTRDDNDEWVMSSSSSSGTSGAEEDEEVDVRGGERGEPEGAPSRRSILECDVSAYELIDKYLRRRSDGVASGSLHMQGQAVDIHSDGEAAGGLAAHLEHHRRQPVVNRQLIKGGEL